MTQAKDSPTVEGKDTAHFLDIEAINKTIHSIKVENPDTFVIIFPHWENNSECKSALQIQQAYTLINNSADLILGHEVKMLQELEMHNNRWVAFGVSNSMFNSQGSHEKLSTPSYSMVSKFIIRDEQGSLNLACRLYPIITDNKQTQYQSTYVTEHQFNEVCQLLTNENTSTTTLFHTLSRNKDEHGYYLELSMQPHKKTLTEIPLLNPIESNSNIWFDSIQSPLTLTTIDKNTLMNVIYTAITKKIALNKLNLPRIITDDKLPRILFVSISDGHNKAEVAMGSGLGIVASLESALGKLPSLSIETYQPIWLKLDIVISAKTHQKIDVSKPLGFDRSRSGIAFTKDTNIAFLAEQLNTYTLMTSDTKLHLRNIGKYLDAHTNLKNRYQKIKDLDNCTLYQFSSDSLFFAGDITLPLYRGHRLFTQVNQEIILRAINLAIQYLIRSIDANGKFIYSYESKTGNIKPKYNILRHAGTVYSMLEAYELLADEKILIAAQRGLEYLINQLKGVAINNKKGLVVVEDGNVKLGGNALAILAIAKYTQVTQDKSYLPTLQKLGTWIVNTQNEQGEYTIHKQVYNGSIDNKFISEYYPGETLFALARLYQLDPQQQWLSSAVNGALFLINVRDKDLPEKKLIHDHWLLYALNEIVRLQPNEAITSHAMKIAKVIIDSQHTQSNRIDWVGGYYNPPRSTPTATRTEGLCASYHLACHTGQLEKANTILSAIKIGIAFQLQTQFLPESAMYLPNPQQAMGGFHHSLTDFEIRIDYVQHNISSLLGVYRILSKKP